MLRVAVCRSEMPRRRGCDSAALTGLRTAFQPVIGGPRESLTASRCERKHSASRRPACWLLTSAGVGYATTPTRPR